MQVAVPVEPSCGCLTLSNRKHMDQNTSNEHEVEGRTSLGRGALGTQTRVYAGSARDATLTDRSWGLKRPEMGPVQAQLRARLLSYLD